MNDKESAIASLALMAIAMIIASIVSLIWVRTTTQISFIGFGIFILYYLNKIIKADKK